MKSLENIYLTGNSHVDKYLIAGTKLDDAIKIDNGYIRFDAYLKSQLKYDQIKAVLETYYNDLVIDNFNSTYFIFIEYACNLDIILDFIKRDLKPIEIKNREGQRWLVQSLLSRNLCVEELKALKDLDNPRIHTVLADYGYL